MRLRCSFCGKPQEEVRRLIAGPEVFICDECIWLCVEALESFAEPLPVAAIDEQIMVNFPDGSSAFCDRASAWRPFVHESLNLVWCAGSGVVHGDEPLAIVAVRAQGGGRVFGEAHAKRRKLDEGHARRVAASRSEELAEFSRAVARYAARSASTRPGVDVALEDLATARRPLTIDLESYRLAPEAVATMTRRACEELRVIPIARRGETLVVAVAESSPAHVAGTIARSTGLRITTVAATEKSIRRAIKKHYRRMGPPRGPRTP
jgi:hypothetical protein